MGGGGVARILNVFTEQCFLGKVEGCALIHVSGEMICVGNFGCLG